MVRRALDDTARSALGRGAGRGPVRLPTPVRAVGRFFGRCGREGLACLDGDCLVDPRYHVVLAVKVCALAGRALAACGRRRTLTAALRRGAPVSGNPARHRPEFAMSSSSTSSLLPLSMRCWCAMSMVSTVLRVPRRCCRRRGACCRTECGAVPRCHRRRR